MYAGPPGDKRPYRLITDTGSQLAKAFLPILSQSDQQIHN